MACVLAVAGCASGDHYAGMPGPGEYDRTFLTHVYESAMAASAADETAEGRGRAEPLKRAARTLAAEERQLMADLYNLAQDKGVPLPNAPGHDGQALVANLEQVPEVEFERTFVAAAGRWADREAALFQDAADHAGDPDVRAIARQNLPAARQRAVTIHGLAGGE